MTMAATPWSSTPSTGVDELLFQNDTVSLCLLVNRRHKTLRVIDFRAGPTVAKRNFVIAAAKRESVEKVFTLVERDEVSTWTRLGFTREGSIPSFYKRSDAWILGAVVANVPPMQGDPRMQLTADDDEDDVPEEAPQTSAAVALAERTIARAKRLVKSSPEKSLPRVTLAPAKDADVKRAMAAAQRSGALLTGFEPFGRDVERRYFSITARGGFELIASTESQSCFGNAFLELLTGPKTEAERLATVAALRTLCDKLLAEGVVSCFAMSASDDVALATAYVFNGFRRTGLLQNHITVGGARKDAIVWSRKLANPADE